MRTNDAAFMCCPVCIRMPHIKAYNDGSIVAFCKGSGFHRHRKVWAYVVRNVATTNNKAERRITIEQLAGKWNMINFSEVRFLFQLDGMPFWERNKNV